MLEARHDDIYTLYIYTLNITKTKQKKTPTIGQIVLNDITGRDKSQSII